MSRLLLLTAAAVAMMACTAAAPANENPTPIAVAAPIEPATPLAASAPTLASADAQSAWCDVRVTPTRHGAQFEALARGETPASYELVITKRDGGGSSDIVQSGDVDLAGGDTQSLGGAEISLERGARYRATLTLSDADGEICSTEVRS